jgi:hypothetical protein
VPAKATGPASNQIKDETTEAADPEIAAAARPRGRAKKAAPTPKPTSPPDQPSEPQSTVTPPPASPTIAQINPAPPSD